MDIHPTTSSSAIGCSFRRRKLLPIGFIAFTLALFLFVRDTDSLRASIPVLKSPEPPTHHVSYVTTTASAHTVVVTETVCPAQVVAVKAVDPVTFVLIMWSEESAIEGALSIKSILLYTSSPIHIHIICEDSAHALLEARLSLLTRPMYNVRVYFYKPSWQSMLDRVEREGSIMTDHSAGLPGLMKLFIHEIIPPTVKKGIFIDTDAFFISDPTILWSVFDRLKPSTAIVMASHPEQTAEEWYNASRICSCIMLLDLEKLRALRLMDSSHYRDDPSAEHPPALSPPAFRAMYGLPGGDGHGLYDNVRLGDQGYWWAIIEHRRDIFEHLDYDFEVTSCLLDMYSTGLGDDDVTESVELSRQIHVKDTPQEGIIVLPKLLHFNCLHGSSIYMDWPGWKDPTNSLTIRWGAAVAYHAGFKWIWLNKGSQRDLGATLETITISDVVFADEKFSRDRMQIANDNL